MDSAIMNKEIYNVKKILRKVIIFLKKKNLVKKIINETLTKNSIYSFTKKDVQLYVNEKHLILPTSIVSKSKNSGLSLVDINNVNIYWPENQTPIDLPWLYHEIYDDFKINPSSYNHPLLRLTDRDWIIDAGAAEGYFSLFALGKTRAKLISIEPIFAMCIALEKTLVSEAKHNEIIIINAALSDTKGHGKLQINNDHICDSKILTSSEMNSHNSEIQTTEIELTTLDKISQDYSLSGTGLIKMDIEGFEMVALTGGVTLLKKLKPSLAIAVYHDFENAKKCANIILKANPAYTIEFRGYYGYFTPPRPYMLFAY